MTGYIAPLVPTIVIASAVITGTQTQGVMPDSQAASPPVSVYFGPIITLISALVAAAVSWGILQQVTKTTERSTQRLEALMMDVLQRVAHMEGSIAEQQRQQRQLTKS